MNFSYEDEYNKTQVDCVKIEKKNKKIQEPLVSVIIPAYNNKNWVTQAIKSVLYQTYRNTEILLIDDGSKVEIFNSEEFNSEKIHYFRNSNHGVAYSRNFGIQNARGKYIAFLDSDDFWKRNKLEVQVEAMERTGMKWSQHSYYYYNDKEKRVTAKVDTYKYRHKEQRFQYSSFRVQTSCFMVDRECVLENGFRFDETKTFGEDTTFYIQFMKKGYELLCIDNYLSYFRIRGANSGMDTVKQLVNRAACWRESRKDPFFKQNVTVLCYMAYFYCYKLEHIAVRLSNNSKILPGLLYVPAWLIFRLEAKRIEIGRK